MIGPTEVRFSKALIGKAEARLDYHRRLLGQHGRCSDSTSLSVADETLALMEARLSRLRANHSSLLEAHASRIDPSRGDATL